MTPQNTPEDRVRIFDREGFPIAEFRAAVERSWSLVDEGRALFTYPSRKTDVVNEKTLQFGNWLLVESTALPPWVGVIDTPREWSPRVVAVHAYTPERVFGWRRGPLEKKVKQPPGALFAYLLSLVNNAEITILKPGDLWLGGKTREETFNPTPLSEDLARIVERSGEEYTWRPVIEDTGRLAVYADWAQVLGADTGALLQEGKGRGNVESVGNILVEDGDIVNDMLAYGDGQSWTSKPTFIFRIDDSISRYGLRQTAEEFSGVTDKTSLEDNADDALKTAKNPTRSFHLNAANVGDTFQYLRIGNILDLRFESMGFTGGGIGHEASVRITGMAYDPASTKSKVELVVEEVL